MSVSSLPHVFCCLCYSYGVSLLHVLLHVLSLLLCLSPWSDVLCLVWLPDVSLDLGLRSNKVIIFIQFLAPEFCLWVQPAYHTTNTRQKVFRDKEKWDSHGDEEKRQEYWEAKGEEMAYSDLYVRMDPQEGEKDL